LCTIYLDLARDTEDIGIPGKCTWIRTNTAAFANDVFERFQRTEQTLAAAVELRDAYNRIKLLTVVHKRG